MNVRACGRVWFQINFIESIMLVMMLFMNLWQLVMEVKLKLTPKQASNNHESPHLYSYVFQKPSTDLPSSFA